MTGYATFTKDLSDKVAEAAKPAQDLSVDVLSTVSETVGKYVPEVPLPEGVPSPREVVDASFDMIEQFLGSQRDYVKRLLDAVAPITGKFEAKPSAKPRAAKTVAA
jgi:hypothetical protein